MKVNECHLFICKETSWCCNETAILYSVERLYGGSDHGYNSFGIGILFRDR